MRFFKQLLSDEDGTTAVEYAVMLSLIVVIAMAGIQVLGNSVQNSFQDSATAIQNAFGN